MDEEEIKSFLERTDDLGARLTGEDKETFAWVVCGYNQCAKLLKETKQKVEEQQKEFILYLRHLSNWYYADGVKQGMVNGILQKYKSIIGYKDEQN